MTGSRAIDAAFDVDAPEPSIDVERLLSTAMADEVDALELELEPSVRVLRQPLYVEIYDKSM